MKALIIALYPYQAKSLDAWHDHGAGMTFTACRESGCDVEFLDMKVLRDDAELAARISMSQCDLVAFGLKSSFYDIGMKIVSIAKKLNKKIMIGGYHATAAGHELVENPDIDYIFYGESEVTLPKFLKDQSNYRREIYGDKPQDLDSLHWFDRTIYSNVTEDCSTWWHGGQRKNMISVLSARGCPYQCQFCQPIEDNHFGKKLRRRSVPSLIEELLHLKNLHSPDSIMIHDDTFLTQPKWIEEFIELYPQVDLPFWASGRADGICENEDLVRKLVKIGWELVSVGFESGSQRILDLMKKGTTVEQNLEAARIIHDTGSKIYGNYMLGLPWESAKDMQATAKMVDQINAEMPSWAFFTPYPGSGLGKDCIENQWSLLSRSEYDRYPGGRKVKFVNYDYVNKVYKGFREEPKEPLCDIIIPVYNNEDLTLACLESIKQCTTPGTYRIILVDNASSEKQRVSRAIECFDHIFIENESNEGFVGAINKGLSQSTAPYVCLLNNDTRVSPNWLSKLINHLQRDPKLGIIGALTEADKSGNPKAMDSHHSLSLHKHGVLVPNKGLNMTLEEVNRFLETHYPNRTTDCAFVAFLCAVIRREVIDKVGFLDPNYAMGMWDDNDYNKAVRYAGWTAELAIDTCIYHRGRSTFKIIQETENFDVNALLKKNKRYLDCKWGVLDTSIISRAIFDQLGETANIGILTPYRKDLIQRYFINSLKAQIDTGFNIQLVVGPKGNEATKAIENLDWGSLNVDFLYSNGLDLWRESVKRSGNKAIEAADGTPEMLVRQSGHKLTSTMIRMDTDDWIAPGFISHVRYVEQTTALSSFLINYQVIGQDDDGKLFNIYHQFDLNRISPFFAIIQHQEPRKSPYAKCHLYMHELFQHIATVPPGYCYTVIHDENRINKMNDKDKYIMFINTSVKSINTKSPGRDSWQERIARAVAR